MNDIKLYMNQDKVKNKMTELLGEKRAPQFIASVIQIANQNDMLAKAEPQSVFNAAAMAAMLDLPLNNNLGFAYIVPYNNRQKDGTFKTVAQFQIGYKGFIQLAQRSGQFKTISAAPVCEGQLVGKNPLEGYQFDWDAKTSDRVIGYAAYFRLINGFEKTLYMTVSELNSHGKKFSKTFKNGLWQNDFDAMAIKTVLKLLLSKYAPLSVEMQRAVTVDQAFINDSDGNDVRYVDNEVEEINHEEDRLIQLMDACKSKAELTTYKDDVPDTLLDYYNNKMNELP